jgi:predicted ATPase
MFESIQFRNLKALQDTTLPLGRFTLLVGPNGSGKSTALQSFEMLRSPGNYNFATLASTNIRSSEREAVGIWLRWAEPPGITCGVTWSFLGGLSGLQWRNAQGNQHEDPHNVLWAKLVRVRVYSLDPENLAASVGLQPTMELAPRGANLAGVLDRLRDEAPERFEALNEEIGRLLPEFDRILFETPGNGMRAFRLRAREGGQGIPAAHLSHGSLLVLALLTLAHLPEPPPLIGVEEPDRGIHPRLLRDVRDALYRLSYPENYGEKRTPVQVVATTQSPYFLDLFKEHPEEVVIAEKKGLEARFERLDGRPDIKEILAEAPLGEVWYSGILGGVPANR